MVIGVLFTRRSLGGGGVIGEQKFSLGFQRICSISPKGITIVEL